MEINQISRKLLTEMTTSRSKSFAKTLLSLAEKIEEKSDPSQTEIFLVSNIYHFLEKLSILENNIQSYVKDSEGDLLGDKLSNLYESETMIGSSKMFYD